MREGITIVHPNLAHTQKECSTGCKNDSVKLPQMPGGPCVSRSWNTTSVSLDHVGKRVGTVAPKHLVATTDPQPDATRATPRSPNPSFTAIPDFPETMSHCIFKWKTSALSSQHMTYYISDSWNHKTVHTLQRTAIHSIAFTPFVMLFGTSTYDRLTLFIKRSRYFWFLWNDPEAFTDVFSACWSV